MRRPGYDCIVASLDAVAEAQDFDSLHLQDVPPRGVTGDDEPGRLHEWRGHMILWAADSATALILHHGRANRVRGTFTSARACGVAVATDEEGIILVT